MNGSIFRARRRAWLHRAGFPLLFGLLVSGSADAHGVLLAKEVRSDIEVVEIRALYDTGEPMAGAEVTVFGAASPAHAWLTGRADREGRFRFVPDPYQPGYWSVRVRQEGHGASITVEVSSGEGGPAKDRKPLPMR